MLKSAKWTERGIPYNAGSSRRDIGASICRLARSASCRCAARNEPARRNYPAGSAVRNRKRLAGGELRAIEKGRDALEPARRSAGP